MPNMPDMSGLVSQNPTVVAVLGFAVIIVQLANNITSYFGIPKTPKTVGLNVVIVLLIAEVTLSIAGAEEAIRVGIAAPQTLAMFLASAVCAFIVFLSVNIPIKRLDVVALCTVSAWVGTLATIGMTEIPAAHLVAATGNIVAKAENISEKMLDNGKEAKGLVGEAKFELDRIENLQNRIVSALEKAHIDTEHALEVTERATEATKRATEVIERGRRTR